MSVEVGQILSGKVTGITNFGAFVDLGNNFNGLVHISEISDTYVKDINDVLSVNEEVKVKILTIEKDGKISLSIRQAKPKEKRQDNRDRKNSNSDSNKPFESRPQSPKGQKQDFDSMMSDFLKDSEDRLSSLRKNTEGKRGGRGGRRS